jgi:hypothetical protein
MSYQTTFKTWQSSRTIAPGGQVELRAEPPEGGGTYVYLWCTEAGTFHSLAHPCEQAEDTAQQTPKPAGGGKSGGKADGKAGGKAGGKQPTSRAAVEGLYPDAETLSTGPIDGAAEVVFEAPQTEGPIRVFADVFSAADQASHVARLEFGIEVTRVPVSETLLTTLEQGLGALSGPRTIKLERSEVEPTADQPLWVAIRNRTNAIGFANYHRFIDRVLCRGEDVETDPDRQGAVEHLHRRRQRLDTTMALHGVDAYEVLKLATQVFLILNCGVAVDETTYDPEEEDGRLGSFEDFPSISARLQGYLGSGRLPYLDRIVQSVFSDQRLVDSMFCEGLLTHRLDPCLIELIWSYWLEEGMQVQTLNEISLRFQNKRRGSGRNPLANLELDPLRPLNNLLWGYIEDERHRLTVVRRAYEYDHHYGLRLYGRAVPTLRPADSRSKFLEAFHTLLYRTSVFYQEDADTTVIADGFQLLNALKEVHMLLAEGAHNQYGDLPWTARVEMLIQQWLLARPETRDFLRGRAMVPYREAWMGQVDSMKRLQGWTDTSITHFHDLAAYGEQILLSVRFGDWVGINDQDHAKNWARYWRPEIQAYIHAYRAATGVDLGADATRGERVDSTLPAVHLQRRAARGARA